MGGRSHFAWREKGVGLTKLDKPRMHTKCVGLSRSFTQNFPQPSQFVQTLFLYEILITLTSQKMSILKAENTTNLGSTQSQKRNVGQHDANREIPNGQL